MKLLHFVGALLCVLFTGMLIASPASASGFEGAVSGVAAGLAMVGSTALTSVPRAVAGMVRADTSDPKQLLASLQQAVEEFRASTDEQLKAKVDDTVLTERIANVDASIAEMQATIDDQARIIAAAQLGGAGVGDLPATDPEYIDGFKAYLRSGDETKVKAAATKVDTEGGYTAPTEWDRTITGKMKLISPIRANARVITVSGNGFKKVVTDRSIGSGWVGETAARPETGTPAFNELAFLCGELYANPAITQQLLEDSALDLEAWLAGEVDTEFARQEGIAFLSGTGANNRPFGVLTYVTGGTNAAKHPFGAIQAVNSGAAAAISADGIVDVCGALPSQYAAGAKFYMARSTTTAVRKLKDGQGNFLWQPSYALGQPQTLNGYAIEETPDMPAVAADAIPVLFGDMEATYLIVDRVGTSVMRDPYSNKPYVHFYTRKRVGGGVHNPEPMKALKIAA